MIHPRVKTLCKIPFTAMLVLRNSTPVDQHPSLMETLNEKMPRQDKLSEMFLVVERLLNIKLMSYTYIRSMSM